METSGGQLLDKFLNKNVTPESDEAAIEAIGDYLELVRTQSSIGNKAGDLMTEIKRRNFRVFFKSVVDLLKLADQQTSIKERQEERRKTIAGYSAIEHGLEVFVGELAQADQDILMKEFDWQLAKWLKEKENPAK